MMIRDGDSSDPGSATLQKTHLLICLIPLLPGLEDVLRHALKLGVTNLHLPQRIEYI
jgi:hypothetical protein